MDELNYCIIKELFSCNRQKLNLNRQKQTSKYSNLGKKLIETEEKTSGARAPSGPLARCAQPRAQKGWELGREQSSPKLRLLSAPPRPLFHKTGPWCQNVGDCTLGRWTQFLDASRILSQTQLVSACASICPTKEHAASLDAGDYRSQIHDLQVVT